MPYIRSSEDGAALFYIDYRPSNTLIFRPNDESIVQNRGETLFFIHGWPMSGRMYEHLMLPLSQTHGVRCLASDRRGFGKSEWSGQEAIEVSYDTFAKDTLAIIKSIGDLGPFTFVCSSMGCGESLLVYELMRDEGLQEQCKGFIWVGPSLPYPLQTDSNPDAPPRALWDMILDGFREDRVGFVRASIGGVFGVPHGITMTDTALEFFINLIYQADAIAIERCCQILSNYDFSEKLESFGRTKPASMDIMILHGDKDQSMPIEASSGLLQALIPGVRIKVYEQAAHGLYYTAASEVMKDILVQINKVS